MSNEANRGELLKFINGDDPEYEAKLLADEKAERERVAEVVRKNVDEIRARLEAQAADERLELFRKIWHEGTPEEYRFARLWTLEPSEKSALAPERQQKVIELIKGAPDSGYFFLGPPGIGKTVWTAALYRHALNVHLAKGDAAPYGTRRYFPVWRITTKRMLDEHTEYALHQADMDELDRRCNMPTVTPEKIAHVRNHQKIAPKLFLEEIDKTKETEARRANLFAVLDAMMAHQGQLVLNSNLTPEEFAERFGADLWWRIEKAAQIVSLFQ